MLLAYLILCGVVSVVALLALRIHNQKSELVGRVRELTEELDAARAELRAGARVDELTGLANRQVFDERLKWVWAVHERTGLPLALVITNADHFQWYNTHHGRDAGDEALIAMATAMRGVVERPSDLLVRLEGDVIVALLPNTLTEGAEFVAEAMAEEVRKLRLSHEQCDYGVQTISAGVASMVPQAEQDVAMLIDAAQAALADAKQAGRDRVCSAPQVNETPPEEP